MSYQQVKALLELAQRVDEEERERQEIRRELRKAGLL